MKYTLENSNEAQRLEFQSELPAYNLRDELSVIEFKKSDLVLDAGCGSGLLSRYLVKKLGLERVEACDFSKVRIEQARSLAEKEGISKVTFFESSLETLSRPDSSYDVVISRYVFEHLKDPEVVALELKRVLKSGGRLLLIDFDGVIFDLETSNLRLKGLLKKVQDEFPFDRFVGRKLPGIMERAGFKDVSWRVSVHDFQGENLAAEVSLNEERFKGIFPELEKILGNAGAKEFVLLFLEEMESKESVLFYNKFIVSGTKP